MTILLPLPETPRRGRSRFSKMLPIPPPSPQIVERQPTTPHSRLPPLPIMATNAVNRRPVAGQTQSTTPSIISMNSVSSAYSDAPELASNDTFANTTSATEDYLADRDFLPLDSPSLPLNMSQQPQSKELDNTLANREGFERSPPRTELWKRRSVIKDRAVAFPELQLENSNGSTASLPKSEVSAIAKQLPRSVASRKPVPLQKDHVPSRGAPQPPDLTGNKLSKLEEKLSKLAQNEESQNLNSNGTKALPVQQFSGRLPTPEYQRADKQQLPTLKFLSPTSPDTPPNDVSPKGPTRSESSSISGTTLVPSNDFPSNLSPTSRKPLTITSSPTMRSPQPKKALPIPILTPEPSPPSTSMSLPTIRSPDSSVDSVTLLSPDIKSIVNFPKQAVTSPLGTVLSALPLNITHLDCYISHKNMRKTMNNMCPIACMVCQKKDSAPRWRCTWCCVSACGECIKVMGKVDRRDLRKVAEMIKV